MQCDGPMCSCDSCMCSSGTRVERYDAGSTVIVTLAAKSSLRSGAKCPTPDFFS